MNYNDCLNKLKLIAVSAAFLSLAACSGESDTNTATTEADAAATEAVADVLPDAATGEGTWGDIVYGDPNAPIEIIEYASLTCPHCASFATQIFPKIKENYIDTGKVKFIYRNFVMNRYDMAASVVARCKSPDVAKRLMKVFFEQQNVWARAEDPAGALASIARRAGGISRTQFDRCMANQDMQKHLVKMGQDGSVKYDVNSTPTIILNGDKVEDFRWENLQALIDAE